MKKSIVIAFIFSFILAYPQGKELFPQAVEAAFKIKTPESKYSYYRVDNIKIAEDNL